MERPPSVTPTDEPERTERKGDEQAHEHVHADKDGCTREESADEHYPHGRTPQVGRHALVGRPAAECADDSKGGSERHEGEQVEGEAAREPPDGHQQPEVEWRLVSIGGTVEGEREPSAAA